VLWVASRQIQCLWWVTWVAVFFWPRALTFAVAWLAFVAHTILERYCCHDEPFDLKRQYAPTQTSGGRLYYRGHLPVLELSSPDAGERGHAHGYLVAPQIREVARSIHVLHHLQHVWFVLCKQAFAVASRVATLLASRRFVAHWFPRGEPEPLVEGARLATELRAALDPHVWSELEAVVTGYADRFRELHRPFAKDVAAAVAAAHAVTNTATASVRRPSWRDQVRVAVHRVMLRWEVYWHVELTLADLVAMHYLPDSKHFSAACTSLLADDDVEREYGDLAEGSGGSAVARKTSSAERGSVLGRHLDWALGRGGAKMLCIVNLHPRRTAAFSFPGNCGVISGWNDRRLVVLMHVCPPPIGWRTDATVANPALARRLPAAFYNRWLLENASTVAELLEHTQRPPEDAAEIVAAAAAAAEVTAATTKKPRFPPVPLGPYHVVATDLSGAGAAVSFYQARASALDTESKSEARPRGGGSRHHVRHHVRGSARPLVVLNFTEPDAVTGSFHSVERRRILDGMFGSDGDDAVPPEPDDEEKAEKLGDDDDGERDGDGDGRDRHMAYRIRKALATAPLLNSPITLQSMTFRPARDSVTVAWNNGFAAAEGRGRPALHSDSMDGFFA
jgi:hypothetical protein